MCKYEYTIPETTQVPILIKRNLFYKEVSHAKYLLMSVPFNVSIVIWTQMYLKKLHSKNLR